MTERDKKIRDLVIKVRGYYDGIDERLTDALKGILRRLDEPDHVSGVRKKVEIEVVKIRALLEKARKQILHNHAGGDYVGSGFAEEDCDKFIVKALALLPEPCPTCGGSEQVPDFDKPTPEGKPFAFAHNQCPECQSQEPDAEFVSELTKRIRSNFEPTRFGPKGFPQIMFKEMIKPDVMEACDRLEAANKRAEKSEFNPRLNMAFPVEWIGQYRNGGCTDPCDMISGPCACGATHHFDEWIIKRKKLVQGKGWVNPEESQEPAEALLVEIWECRVCHEKAPCRVVIVYSENTVTKSFKGNLRFRNKVCICRESHFPEWKLLAEPESQEPAEKPESEFVKRCRKLLNIKIRDDWKRYAHDIGGNLLEACVHIEAANKRAEKAEADNEAIGQRYKGLEQHYNRALQTGKQLTAMLDAEGFRFREQKQISKELQAKLAEANGVIEMLKEKGIG